MRNKPLVFSLAVVLAAGLMSCGGSVKPEASPAPAAGVSTNSAAVNPTDVVWDEAVYSDFQATVPPFAQPMAKPEIERRAAAKGVKRITAEVYAEIKKETGH